MKVTNDVEDERAGTREHAEGEEPLLLRMLGQATKGAGAATPGGVVIGELLASKGENQPPRVQYPGQAGSAPMVARSAIELPDVHTGKQVVLIFEDADPTKPIIIGMLRDGGRSAVDAGSRSLDVEVDGERLVINAREQLVLRCGRASITLTKAGKVIIQGEYLSSRAAGVNRIKGGSVQIN